MRLSEWTAGAPAGAVMPAVLATLAGNLGPLGVDPDPDCPVLRGDDPHVRRSVLVPTTAGLVTAHVRAFVPQAGPRASGKLNRWSRVQIGEFVAETQGAHRVASATFEGANLRGVDQTADAVGVLLRAVFALIDGRLPPTGPGRDADGGGA